MAITRTAMVDDDGSGTTGTIINNAWKQELYNQIDGLVATPVAVPFNAANFKGGGSMIWTVDAPRVEANRYTIHGKILHWTMVMGGAGTSTLSGTPHFALVLVVPGGGLIQTKQTETCAYQYGIAGTPTSSGLWITGDPGGTTISIIKNDTTNFALGSGPALAFNIFLELQ